MEPPFYSRGKISLPVGLAQQDLDLIALQEDTGASTAQMNKFIEYAAISLKIATFL